ncbi:MAG: hypothetical protein Q4C95_01615, partial [Planctomycetia bacterium]|nr:hypothetical protein [Planctomycetia bacterium]
MSKFLAVDWDSVEIRFVLGSINKETLFILKAGSTSFNEEINRSVSNIETDDEANSLIQANSIQNADNEELKSSSSLVDLNELLLKELNQANNSIKILDDQKSNAEIVQDESNSEIVKNEELSEEIINDELNIESTNDSNEESKVESDSKPLPKTEPGILLKKLLKEHRVGSADLLACIGRSNIDVLFMNLPNASETEIPEMIKNQVLRDSTTFVDGHPLDFVLLGKASQEMQQRFMTVSMSRIELKNIRHQFSIASRKPKKIECRETAISEFLISQKLKWTHEDENNFDNLFRNVLQENDSDELKKERFNLYLDSESDHRAILLIQELNNEVNFVIYDEKPISFRSFKIQTGLSIEDHTEKLFQEIIRTIAIGVDDSMNRVIDRVFLFGLEKEQIDLRNKLQKQGIYLKVVNPFELPGIVSRIETPKNPGRFAALIGAILAERPKNKPLIDFLHPHEKPKPPNYILYSASLILLTFILFIFGFFWNKSELNKQAQEIAKLEKERDQLASEIQLTTPLGTYFQILQTAYAWDNQYGVIVLDELRDITIRIPQAPNLVVNQLSYTGNFNNWPVFIIQAKVSSVAVYQQFIQSLSSDRTHRVVSNGIRPNPGGGGFPYEFTAHIYCQRRPFNQFLFKLPPELQKISNNYPENYWNQQNPVLP